MTLTPKSVAGLAATVGLALLTSAASAQMSITKYGAGKDTGSGITFTGPILGSFPEADGFFNTEQDTIADFNTGANYSGKEAFTLDIKGNFTLTAPTTYTFHQRSDDGSYSFLTGPGGYNNTPLISIHGPTASSKGDGPKTLNLAAGAYSYEVQYSESNGAPGSLRFTTPTGIAPPAAVPEPSSVASMGLGGLGLLGLLLRARKAKRLSA